jgi:phage FluMu protein Com
MSADKATGTEDERIWRRWLEALHRWHADPSVSVSCPRCQKADLQVFDTPHEQGRHDRWTKCPACGLVNAITVVDPD